MFGNSSMRSVILRPRRQTKVSPPAEGTYSKSSPRRRWLRIGIVAVIAAGLGFAFVRYRLSRLNEAEKQILGEWTYPDLTGRPITNHIQFNPDRSYLLWSVDGQLDWGTWAASEEQLTITTSPECGLPIAYGQSPQYLIDRTLHPGKYTSYPIHLAVEELSESSIRLRIPDGKKVVYHRAVPAAPIDGSCSQGPLGNTLSRSSASRDAAA
jgi:hypothetical protein